MLQPKKKIVKTPVVKNPVRKKPITPVDDYKTMKDPATGKKGTMGGEGTRPPFTPEERKKMPKVGNMGSAKNGKSFPDLNKDGKITRADILKGRGVIAKKGATVKKAQEGGALTYTNPRGKQYSLPQGASGPLTITRPNGSTRTIENREKYTKKMKRVFNRNTVDGVRQGTMTDTRQKNGGVTKKAKSGASMKKCKYGCK